MGINKRTAHRKGTASRKRTALLSAGGVLVGLGLAASISAGALELTPSTTAVGADTGPGTADDWGTPARASASSSTATGHGDAARGEAATKPAPSADPDDSALAEPLGDETSTTEPGQAPTATGDPAATAPGKAPEAKGDSATTAPGKALEATGDSAPDVTDAPTTPGAGTGTAAETPTEATSRSEAPASDAPAAKKRAGAVSGPLDAFDKEMVGLINQARAKAGVEPLQYWSGLRSGALTHSGWMNGNDFEHAADGMIGADASAAGCAGGWAENIYWDSSTATTPEEAMASYMGSAGHRANILDPELRFVATGTVATDGGLFNTQRFADTCS
ncbi:CAP domain-containing protein [Georgenia sp. SYP-B2076]|uniref:CAP domain-containing protein n=1 Tax=Georgenia sp. SYP-B2076 TaxID=2495881 RepID=UPI000F8EF50E|nr:CAP domain-containing protein [Georgenia sp. SYP-B2076]